MSDDKSFRLYGYRWVVLGVFMAINLTNPDAVDWVRAHHRPCCWWLGSW